MITQSTIDLSWALPNTNEVRFTQVNSAPVFTGPHGRPQAVFSRIEAFLVGVERDDALMEGDEAFMLLLKLGGRGRDSDWRRE